MSSAGKSGALRHRPTLVVTPTFGVVTPTFGAGIRFSDARRAPAGRALQGSGVDIVL